MTKRVSFSRVPHSKKQKTTSRVDSADTLAVCFFCSRGACGCSSWRASFESLLTESLLSGRALRRQIHDMTQPGSSRSNQVGREPYLAQALFKGRAGGLTPDTKDPSDVQRLVSVLECF